MTRSKRTPLSERPLPNYSLKEERMNMYSHLFGVLCALVMLGIVIHATSQHPLPYARLSSVVYVLSVLAMLVVSSVYHGLPKGMSKQVMRVVDHCVIFFTIAGTYTPITLLGIRLINPVMAWSILGVEWVLAILGATLNAIDLHRYSRFSMACYLGMGWCVIISLKPAIQAMTLPGFMWILGGGIAYTIGAILYQIGKKKPYRHAVFHIFVLLGVLIQFVGVWKYLL